MKNAYCILSVKTVIVLRVSSHLSELKSSHRLENFNLRKMESTKIFGAMILILVLISGVVAIMLSLYRAYRRLNPREKPRVTP